MTVVVFAAAFDGVACIFIERLGGCIVGGNFKKDAARVDLVGLVEEP